MLFRLVSEPCFVVYLGPKTNARPLRFQPMSDSPRSRNSATRAADPARKKDAARPRRVTIEEAVGLAAALGVPLLSLLLPDDELAVTPRVTLDARLAGAWMIGFVPLRREDATTYATASATAVSSPIHVLNVSAIPTRIVESLLERMETPGRDEAEALRAFVAKERLTIEDLEQIMPGLPEDAQNSTAESLKMKRAVLDRIEKTLSRKQRRRKS
jgi:hypothetical protein